MPAPAFQAFWDINQVQILAAANNSTTVSWYGAPTGTPENGGQMVFKLKEGWQEAWPSAAAAKAAYDKLNPPTPMNPLEESPYNGQSNGFLDTLGGYVSSAGNIAQQVAGVVNAFRGGNASPDAQQLMAQQEQQRTRPAADTILGLSKPVFFGALAAVGAAIVGAFFFLRRKGRA